MLCSWAWFREIIAIECGEFAEDVLFPLGTLVSLFIKGYIEL
jgi:hypothetical protein